MELALYGHSNDTEPTVPASIYLNVYIIYVYIIIINVVISREKKRKKGSNERKGVNLRSVRSCTAYLAIT